MNITLTIFILMALCSLNANAQKLYKFQDKQGIWHFTDKPTATELNNAKQNIEIRQLKVASKQLVQLLQKGEERHPQFYIRNDYSGPVEVEIEYSQHDNVATTPDLPRKFVIKPGESDTLFTVSGIKEFDAWQLSIKYRYIIGHPLPNYHSTTGYLPPLAPKASFQISQGFEGSFSHTDEQNKYAVDIAMPIGTPVYAAKAGMVMEVDDDFFKSGTNADYSSEANNIRILHNDGAMSVYAHLELEKAQVYPGLTVTAGQLIGYSGNTGFSSGPHLHFAVQINKGMELVSVPFTFVNEAGQAEEPLVNTWLKGVEASRMGNAVE